MSAPFAVREAAPADAAAVEALYRTLVSNPAVTVDGDRIGRIAADPHNFLFVLERAGEAVGTALLTLCLDPMFGDRPYAVLENVVVAPGARGGGGGRALLGHAEAVARSARCTKLMLLSAAHREGAHAFFARLGFDGERKRGFVKYLGGLAPPSTTP